MSEEQGGRERPLPGLARILFADGPFLLIFFHSRGLGACGFASPPRRGRT